AIRGTSRLDKEPVLTVADESLEARSLCGHDRCSDDERLERHEPLRFPERGEGSHICRGEGGKKAFGRLLTEVDEAVGAVPHDPPDVLAHRHPLPGSVTSDQD